MSKPLLSSSNSYQRELGKAQNWPCCLPLPSNISGSSDFHTQNNWKLMCIQCTHARSYSHTFRCGQLICRRAESGRSFNLTGEAIWQAKNKTRKWRLEMCLVFSLTSPRGLSMRGQSITHGKATFRSRRCTIWTSRMTSHHNVFMLYVFPESNWVKTVFVWEKRHTSKTSRPPQETGTQIITSVPIRTIKKTDFFIPPKKEVLYYREVARK